MDDFFDQEDPKDPLGILSKPKKNGTQDPLGILETVKKKETFEKGPFSYLKLFGQKSEQPSSVSSPTQLQSSSQGFDPSVESDEAKRYYDSKREAERTYQPVFINSDGVKVKMGKDGVQLALGMPTEEEKRTLPKEPDPNTLPSTSNLQIQATDARLGSGSEGTRERIASPKALGKALVTGAASGVSGTLKSIAIASKELDFFDEYTDKKATDLATYKAGEWVDKITKDLVGELSPEEQQNFSVKVFSGVGQMGTMMVGGIGAKAIKMSPILTSAAIGAATGASSEWENAIASGASTEEAAKVFWINGVINSSDALPMVGVFRKLDKYTGGLATGALAKKLSTTIGGRVTNEMAQGFINEAVQESVQQVLTNVTAQNTYDVTRDIWEGVGESFAIGGIIGTTMTGVASAIREKRASENLTPEEDAQLAKAEEFAESKIKESEAQERQQKSIINHAEKVKENLQDKGLDEDTQDIYVAKSLVEKVASEKAEKLTDPTLIKKQKEIAKEAAEIKEQLLAGIKPEDVVTEKQKKEQEKQQKEAEEKEKVTIEIERLTVDKKFDIEKIDAQIEDTDGRESKANRIKLKELNEKKKRINEDYKKAVEKLSPKEEKVEAKKAHVPPIEETDPIKQASEAAWVDIQDPNIAKLFAENPEQGLKEAAQQLNASKGEAETARKVYGDTISDIALKLYPKEKVTPPSTPSKEVADVLSGVDVKGLDKYDALEKQQGAVEDYAKSKGIWNNFIEGEFGEPDNMGAESMVWHDKEKGVTTKAQSMTGFDNVGDKLKSIELYNEAFPENKLTVKGFGVTGNGAFSIITEQPFAEGRPATKAEVDNHLANKGFEKISDGRYVNKEKGILIEDVNDRNAILSNGEVKIIDAKVTKSSTPQAKEQPEKPKSPAPSGIVEGEKTDLDVSGKDVTLPSEAATTNTPIQTQETFSEESRTAIANTKQPPQQKEKKLTQRLSEVDIDGITDPYDRVLHYFANKGKIHPSAIQQIFGTKGRTEKTTEGEKRSKIGLLGKNAPTIDQLAHQIWEDLGMPEGITTMEIRDAVESVVQSHNGWSGAAKELTSKYDYDALYERYMETKEGQEVIEIAEKLTDEEINHILELDSQKDKEQELEDYIDSLDKPPTEGELVPAGGEGGGKKGITHEATQESTRKAGLPDYEGQPVETHAERIAKAKADIAANPNLANETMEKGEKNPGSITPQDNAVLAVYKGALDKELEANPSKELFDRISRLAKVLNPEGSYAGKLLESRKLIDFNEDNLANFLLDKEAAQGTALTEEQIKKESAKYEELKKAKNDLEKLLIQEREQHAKDIAELGLNKARAKAKREAKKSHEEYKAERKASVEAAKEDLKRIRLQGGLQATIVPGSRQFKELVAIAPHVKKVLESLANEGFDKLDVVVTQLHAEFKDVIDGLTKNNIIDIIGGEYDEKQQTRNQKVNTVLLLKREAQLLKELAAERKGEQKAKTEKNKTAINRRIDDLKKKIEEVRRINKEREKESPFELNENEEKNIDEQIKLNKKAKQLEEDIKNKKYLKEKEKPISFARSRATQVAQDRVMDLENKIRHERSVDEYSKRSKTRKFFDKVQELLGLRRLVQTTLDMSIPFRQGVTLLGAPLPMPTLRNGKLGVEIRGNMDVWAKSFRANLMSVFSPKNFDRIMHQIRHDKDYHDMVNDKVVFNDMGAADPTLHNEDFRKSFAYKIPIVSEPIKASNRSADAFLNVARYELYKKFKKRLENNGLTRESDPEAFRFIGNWVMSMTGRGHMLNALENSKAQYILGNTFYGARLMASRFNLLNPVTYFDPRVPKAARVEAMKDMISFTTTIMATGLALMAAGGAVSFDPDDGDFLQVRFGDKVYDISGGMANYIRTFLRIVNAAHTKATGTKYEGREAMEKAAKSGLNFFRNKTAPNTAYALDAMFGKAYGDKFDPSDIVEIYPMYADDVIEAFKEEGVTSLATVLLPNLLGVGYGSYHAKGQIDSKLEDLLERNLRSDEMNNEKIYNYNEGGRQITDKEFDKFGDKRDEEIKKGITELFNQGALVLNEDLEPVQKPYKELTPEQVAKETSSIKAAATVRVKKEMFGEREKTDKELAAEAELESAKKLKKWEKEDEKKE